MPIRSLITLASALTTLGVPAAAGAGDTADEPNCSVEAKRSYRLAKASKPGMPVRITCDAGQAETFNVKLRSYARRAVKQAGGSKIVFILGIKQSDGYFHNNPGPGGSDRSRLLVD